MADVVAGEAFKCTFFHIERELGYLLYFKSNVRSLASNVEELTSRRNDVMRMIDAAKMNNELIQEVVETWLRHVKNVLIVTTDLTGKAGRIDRWYKGWVPCSRFSAGRSSQKMSATVKELLAVGNSFGVTVTDAYGRLNQNLALGNLESSAAFEAFPSRVITRDEIIHALKDDAFSLLGVHGMSGVGKTTLISALVAYMKEEKIFDQVVVVTLTETPEIKAIQGDIANWLDLKLDDGDTRMRAAQLFHRLSQDRKTLIVLDNLWQAIKLAEVGIPEKLKNCKVVFTTRNSDVCNAMGLKTTKIKVEVLFPKESWDLFRKNAGEAVDSPAFRKVARNVLKHCQGLPLLIVTLGNALYEKDISYWDAALQSLQDSSFLRDSLFTGAPYVFSIMRLSYDYLEREDIKLCFLLCCLFPPGYPISKDQLLHYMVGENVLPDVATLRQRRHHLHVIVDKLTSSCLLLQAKSGCIMMHDIVREVALAIASEPREGRGFIVRAGMTMRDWHPKQIADCKRLSFITTRGSRINWSLPSQIQAAHLLTMSFNGNEKLEEIPSDFFREATSLLSLDLSYTGIKRLPQSITCLVNLRTLLLEGCFHLEDVDLSNDSLEILSLRDSMIESFATSAQMMSLKLLDLSHTSRLQNIGRNILSSFIELEELYLFDSFKAWDREEREPGEKDASSSKGKDRAKDDNPEESEEYASSSKGNGSAKEEYASFSVGMEQRRDYARLSELASLHGLISLEFHVGNTECLFMNNFSWEELKRFKIAVGVISDFSPFGIDDGLKMVKSMYISCVGYTPVAFATWVIALLRRTHFLQLSGSWSLSDLVEQDAERRIFSDLKVLIMAGCLKDTSCLMPYDVLARLQLLTKLVVTNCDYLKVLIEPKIGYQSSSPPSFSSLPMLTYLRVDGCAKLKFLFPMTVVRLLLQLEKLYISDCSGMEKVIKGGDGSTATDREVLPKLKILSLERLPSLSHIIKKDVHLEWNSLEELTVQGCQMLRKLPLGTGSVPKLKKLMVDTENFYVWFDMLEWDDQNVQYRLQLLLNRVSIRGCTSLDDVQVLKPWPLELRVLKLYDFKSGTLIPCDWLVRMRTLERLEVDYALELEKLIDFGGKNMKSRKKAPVVNSPELTPSPVFDNLILLKVSRCDRLKYVFPMRVARDLSQLQELDISECSRMEMIIGHETVEEDLDFGGKNMESKTQDAAVDSSGVAGPSSSVDMVKFKKLIPSPVFQNLRCVKVGFCDKLKYLFPIRVVRDLSQLQELHIYRCPVMEMIIVHGTDKHGLDADENQEIFPKLRLLHLHTLKQLSSILRQGIVLDFPSLEELRILDVGLTHLPLGPASAPNLRRIFAYNGWSDAMQWEDEKLRLRLEDIRNSGENSKDFPQDNSERPKNASKSFQYRLLLVLQQTPNLKITVLYHGNASSAVGSSCGESDCDIYSGTTANRMVHVMAYNIILRSEEITWDQLQ